MAERRIPLPPKRPGFLCRWKRRLDRLSHWWWPLGQEPRCGDPCPDIDCEPGCCATCCPTADSRPGVGHYSWPGQ